MLAGELGLARRVKVDVELGPYLVVLRKNTVKI